MPPNEKIMNMRDREDEELITIRGIITPCEWDEKGNAIAIAISTFHEEEYVIDEDKQSGQLFSMIRQAVEVNGFIRCEDGRIKMKVKKYRGLLLSKKGGFE